MHLEERSADSLLAFLPFDVWACRIPSFLFLMSKFESRGNECLPFLTLQLTSDLLSL